MSSRLQLACTAVIGLLSASSALASHPWEGRYSNGTCDATVSCRPSHQEYPDEYCTIELVDSARHLDLKVTSGNAGGGPATGSDDEITDQWPSSVDLTQYFNWDDESANDGSFGDFVRDLFHKPQGHERNSARLVREARRDGTEQFTVSASESVSHDVPKPDQDYDRSDSCSGLTRAQ